MIFDIAIIVLLLGAWLSIRELPLMLGSSSSSGVIRKGYIPFIIVLSMLPAFKCSSDVVGNISAVSNLSNPITLLVICFAAAASVWIFSLFSKWTSIVYSLSAAIYAANIHLGSDAMQPFFWQSSIAWIVSPVLSFLLSIVLFQFFRYTMRRTGLHLIALNRILRVLLTLSLIIVLFSFAVNNGSILLAMTASIDPHLIINIGGTAINGEFITWIFFLVLVLALYFYPVRKISERLSIKLFDINTETSVVIMISMSLVLLLFSNNVICSIFGLQATPVSPAHIALGAIIGIGWVHRNVNIDKRELVKSCLSVIALPALSFVLTSIVFKIIAAQGDINSLEIGITHAQKSFDITTFALSAILFILTIVVIYFYVSKSRTSERARLKLAEDRNQLNEMQKALVELEIKVIQSENNNLHKRLEVKRKDLINNALWIGQQRDFLDVLSSDILMLKRLESIDEIKNQILVIEGKIKDKKAFSHEMNELYSQVEILHKDYSLILHERFPDLTEQERRLATLLRLGFSTKELASIMSITPKSVEVCRYRLRKKLNLNRDANLINFIKSL